jgi:hypothetical protein
MPRAWQGSYNKYIIVLILVLNRTLTQSINESVSDSVQCITRPMTLESGPRLSPKLMNVVQSKYIYIDQF